MPGECRNIVEWVGDVGAHGCAYLDEASDRVHVEFLLDATLRKDALAPHAMARLTITSASEGTTLMEHVGEAPAEAPYYFAVTAHD